MLFDSLFLAMSIPRDGAHAINISCRNEGGAQRLKTPNAMTTRYVPGVTILDLLMHPSTTGLGDEEHEVNGLEFPKAKAP